MEGSLIRNRALLASAAALIVALAGWWWMSGTQGALRDSSVAPDPSGRTTQEPPLEQPGAAELMGDGVAAPSSEPPVEPSSAPTKKRWTLTFECVDSEGEPTRWTHAYVYRAPDTEPSLVEHLDGALSRGEVELEGQARIVIWVWNSLPWVSEPLVPPASGTLHVVARFEPGVSISGRVFQQDGVTPLTAGKVTVWCSAQKDPWRPALSSRWSIVGKDGTFTVPGLYPGPARVMAEAYDLSFGTKARAEADGGDEHVRLVLGKISAAGLLIVDAQTGFAPNTKRLLVSRIVGDEEHAFGHASWSTRASDRPAVPGFWQYVKPGTELGFRAHAQGYEDSGPVVFKTSADGGKEIFTIRLRADPTPLTTVRILLRAAEGDAPKRVRIARIHGGSTNSTTLPVPDGEHTIEAMPGSHVIEVGGASRPKEGDRSTFWVPQRFEFETAGGEALEYDVTLEQGGWVVFVGDPSPRPGLMSFRRGETTLTRSAKSGILGRGAGVLPAGTWTLTYEGRKDGARVQVSKVIKVRRGKVSYVDVTSLELERLEDD